MSAVVLVAVLENTSHAATLVNETFDDGSYADTGWTAWLQNGACATGTTLSPSSAAAYHGAYGLDVHYVIGDNPRGDCELHQDNNTSLVRRFSSPGLSHYFVRGYVRFPFDVATFCNNNLGQVATQPWIQRKLIYNKPPYWPGWHFVINAWPWENCATDGYNVSLSYTDQGTMPATLWGNEESDGFHTANNHLHVNTWYYLEVETDLRAPGSDIVRMWLAEAGTEPKLIFERTDLSLRTSEDAANGTGVGEIEVGRQVDIARSVFTQGVDEPRHWDELVIATTRIGPIEGLDAGDGGTPDASTPRGNDAGPADAGGKPADAAAEAGTDDGGAPACCDDPVFPNRSSAERGGCACSLGRGPTEGTPPLVLAALAALAGVMAGCRRRSVRKHGLYRPLPLAAVLLLAAAENTSRAATVVSETFDDGSYADTGWGPWLQSSNCTTGTTLTPSADAAYRGPYGLDVHYLIGDNPRGDCYLHQDNNTSLVYLPSPSLNHYFVRGYFRFPFDTATLCSQPWVNRKLMYFRSSSKVGLANRGVPDHGRGSRRLCNHAT